MQVERSRWQSTRAQFCDSCFTESCCGHAEEEPEAVSSADQEADEILAPLVQAASAESVIQQPSQELGYSASGLDLSPTLSQTSPENAVIGVTGHEEEAEMHGEAVPQQALQDALVLAEARRLMDQLQQIGFPVNSHPPPPPTPIKSQPQPL